MNTNDGFIHLAWWGYDEEPNKLISLHRSKEGAKQAAINILKEEWEDDRSALTFDEYFIDADFRLDKYLTVVGLVVMRVKLTTEKIK